MKNIEKQFDIGHQSTIDLSLDKGKLEIWGWDNSTCKVIAESDSAMNFDFDLRTDYLQMEFSKGDKVVQLYVPKHSKLLIDGSYVDTKLSNLDGSICMEIGRGNIKITNFDGSGIIEVEQGDVELENIKGKLFVEKGKGSLQGFNISGTVKVESGNGHMELTSISGECDIDSGKGSIVIKDSKGNMNLECGLGDLTLDHCNFKRLGADGKGDTTLIISNEQNGVWNLSRNGNYSIIAPLAAQLDFKIECRNLNNNIPGLSFTQTEGIYKGSMGLNPKGTVYIEDAREITFNKGDSQGVIDIGTIDEGEKETLKILEMLKQGIITSDQAEELLVAIGETNLEEVE